MTVQMIKHIMTKKLAAFETFNFAMDPERKRTLKATVVYGGSLSNPFVPRLSHPLIHIFQQVHFPCFHTIKKLIYKYKAKYFSYVFDSLCPCDSRAQPC